MNSLLEQAARVLEHQPTRSMEANALYRRAARETGLDMPFNRFMDALRGTPDHFAVIPPDPVVGAAAAWDPRQRCLYEAAMEAAGMTQPLIVLAERRVRRDELDHSPAAGPDTSRPATAADVFGDAHAALTQLLHASDPDDPFHAAVACALEELHAARRVLRT
ncbi:MAG TPA: hypothetical protein VK912_04820 [Longimicrobiales bacterium]|nr:hypothetical protein [Longimicrobiales bacterium]